MRDASLDPVLNGVTLANGKVVAWAVAFPSVGRHLERDEPASSRAENYAEALAIERHQEARHA